MKRLKFFEMKLKKQRTVVLEITSEITSIIDEIAALSKIKIDESPDNVIEIEKDSMSIHGATALKEIIHVLLVNRYDNILNVLAMLDDTTPERLENEKSLFDIGDMIFDALSNERLMRFFPRLNQLTQKTQSDI